MVSGKPVVIRRAHRVIAEWTFGPAPPEHHACHHCDNKLCCNPLHIYWGTPKANSQDMTRRRRGNNGERSPHSRLTNDQRREIVRRSEAGESNKAIAKDYPVKPAQIWKIVRHRGRWD